MHSAAVRAQLSLIQLKNYGTVCCISGRAGVVELVDTQP